MISSSQTETMLIARAASKLVKSQSDLVESARFALREAGNWKDEVRIDVFMQKPYSGTRCARLLHGVPSPRYWATPFKAMVRMPAKDVLYFFAPALVNDCIPDLHSEEDLAQWLTDFSSTRFEDQLVQSLVEHARAESSRFSLPRLAYTVAAQTGASIDRHAWFTRQRSMTLANSTPVWHYKKSA